MTKVIRMSVILPFLSFLLVSVNQSQEVAAQQTNAERIAEIERNIEALAAELESCLLYTSPSPRDRSLSRMPSSA